MWYHITSKIDFCVKFENSISVVHFGQKEIIMRGTITIEGRVVETGLKTFPASDYEIFILEYSDPRKLACVMARIEVWCEVKPKHKKIHLVSNLRKGDNVRCVLTNKRIWDSFYEAAFDLVSINVLD